MRPDGSSWVFYGVAAVLVIALLAGLVVLVSGGDGDDGARGPATAEAPGDVADSGLFPASYSQVASTSVFSGISRRSTDSAPLTEAEVFGGSAKIVTDSTAGARLVLRAKRLDQRCSDAVWGTAVAATLRQGGCTQAARMLYADLKKGYAATATIFNLNDVGGADRLVELFESRSGGGFVVPLRAKTPLDHFGSGFGVARGVAMGHYAVVGWVQRVDGTGDQADGDLLSLLVTVGEPESVLGRAAATTP